MGIYKLKSKRLHKTPVSRLALELARRMDAQRLTIKDVASEADLTYEHMRRLVNGEALPSIEALQRICKVLNVDLHEMTTLLFAEKALRTYGSDTIVKMSGKNNEMAALEVNWPYLNAEQKATLTDIVEGMARRNAMKSRL